jgi:hypothetical protein
MTRTLVRSLGLAAAGALLLAACGGNAATTAPTQAAATQAPATQAPATQAPGTAAPSSAEPGFSFALPSGFNADTELEDMLPDQLGGQDVITFSMTGDSFMGTGGEGTEELAAALQQLGKTPADLSVAVGGSDAVAVFAYRLKGVDANTFFGTFLQMAGQTDGATVTDATIAGKAVKKVVTDSDETIYLYSSGDVLFGVGGEDVSDALLTEAFSKLP